MAEEIVESKESTAAAYVRLVVTVVVCSIAANFIERNGWMGNVPALFVCYTAALLVSYWIPPRPPLSYAKYVLHLGLWVFLALAAFWWLPALLSLLIWRPLAHALPVFLFFVSFHYLPALRERQEKSPFWQWLLLGLFMAFAIGVVEYYAPE